jgi:hypothetical protein
MCLNIKNIKPQASEMQSLNCIKLLRFKQLYMKMKLGFNETKLELSFSSL